ncbi:MAG: DMT family transporter [Planctomycetota bacterium]
MQKAAIMLVLCCLLWGYSFPVMQLSNQILESHYYGKGGAPAANVVWELVGLRGAFLGWRFGLAALITAVFWRSARSGYTRLEVSSGLALGLLFAVSMVCQVAGLRYTLPSASSFLTSLTVVFTPIVQALVFKRRVTPLTWLGVVLALAGMTIISLPNPNACINCQVLPIPPIPYLGEAMTTLGAAFFTVLILGLDKIGSSCNPVRMSVMMFVSSAFFCTLAGLAFCGQALYRMDVISPLIHDQKFILLIVTLTFFSSVLAIQFMYRYQSFVSPAVASVIYATESVFATLFSVVLFHTEELTAITVVGGSLILTAFLLVTLPSNAKPEPAT